MLSSNFEEWFPRELAIARHKDQKAKWPWLAKFGHWVFVSWRCPCCKIERERKHAKQ